MQLVDVELVQLVFEFDLLDFGIAATYGFRPLHRREFGLQPCQVQEPRVVSTIGLELGLRDRNGAGLQGSQPLAMALARAVGRKRDRCHT